MNRITKQANKSILNIHLKKWIKKIGNQRSNSIIIYKGLRFKKISIINKKREWKIGNLIKQQEINFNWLFPIIKITETGNRWSSCHFKFKIWYAQKKLDFYKNGTSEY